MPATESRIDLKILLLFMVLGLLPIGVGSLILLTGARDAHAEASSAHLGELADNGQVVLSNFLQDRILQIASVAMIPEVRAAVVRANPLPVTPEQEQIESDWEALDPNTSSLVRGILDNTVSRFLRDYAVLIPALREVIVTDVHGRVVSATGKTSDFFQADEKWWQAAYRQGIGGHFISDIQYDESTAQYAIEIAEPILDPSTNTAIGVIKALFDPQEIFGLVNSIDAGRTGEASLIRGDGTYVVSPRTGQPDAQEFPGAELVRAAVNENKGSVSVGEGDSEIIVGLPTGRLKDTFPELDWYLVVSENRTSLLGSFVGIQMRFLYLILFSVVVVIVLSMVFSRILSRPVIETDPHLEKL